jgi:hypothetical protein
MASMALAGCGKHGKPEGKKRNYVRSVAPIGYPLTATICGGSGCKEPAMIWLNDGDDSEYQKGERVFSFPNGGVSVKVS